MFVKTNFEDSKLYATIVKFVIREHKIESNKIMYIWWPVLGVGIGRFRRKSEENFIGRSEVGKVGNFTDFTDRPLYQHRLVGYGFGRLSRFGLGRKLVLGLFAGPKSCIGPISWAEILYWTYSFFGLIGPIWA
jgi:hypothetical protein